MWILGSRRRDLCLFVLPGLLGIALSLILPAHGALFGAYAFLTLSLVDSGHVYTTAWRTWLDPVERGSHPRYWLVPLLVFVAIATWIWLGGTGLWTFVVYATVHHNIRQFHGFSRWYQKLNRRACVTSGIFLHTLTILPFALYHFREGVPGGIYTEAELPLFPSTELFREGFALYLAVLVTWITHELFLIRHGVREWNRLLSLALPILLYGCGFLLGSSLASILFPILLAHGVGYFAVQTQTLHRLKPSRNSGRIALTAVLLTALVFGAGEFLLEEFLLRFQGHYANASFAQIALTALYLVPLLSHYYFDMHLWTGKHPRAQVIFGPSVARSVTSSRLGGLDVVRDSRLREEAHAVSENLE